MPSRWTGTREERLARLDEAQRRCDGNGRRCAHSATTRYTLARVKDGLPLPGEPVTRLSCSRHKVQFAGNPGYVVVNTVALPPRPTGKSHPHTVYKDRPNG